MAASFAGRWPSCWRPPGVLLFDSTHPAAKRAAAPHLVRALGLARELDDDLDRWAEESGASGANLGRHGGRRRHAGDAGGIARPRPAGAATATGLSTRRSRERFDLPRWSGSPRRSPSGCRPTCCSGRWSRARCCLRSRIWAGPASSATWRSPRRSTSGCGIPRQQPLPRWSGVLVEPRVDRVLEKFGVTLEELLAPPGALEARLVRSQLPAGGRRRARAASDAALEDGLRGARALAPPRSIRPSPGRFRRRKNRRCAGTQDVEKKLVQHLKRRQETELGQIGRARTAVLPEQQAPGTGADRGAVPGALRAGLLERAAATRSRTGTATPLKGAVKPS